MEITWHGELCFTIKGKKTTIVIDPYANGKHKLKNVKADTVLLTNNYDENATLTKGAEDSVQLSGPGEYEIKGAAIISIPAYTTEKEEGNTTKGRIVIHSFMIDDIRFCHLGTIGEDLDEEMLSKIGNVDILMVPIAGENTLNPKKAHETIEKIEPRIVIPMNYSDEEIEAMIKEMGISEPEALDVFEITSRNKLPEETTEVVLLNVTE